MSVDPAARAETEYAAWRRMVDALLSDARRRGASPTVKGWSALCAQGLLVGVVGAVAFWFARDNLLGYIDGQYLLTLLRNQHEFAPAAPILSPNPLQGLDDLWYFANTRWIPELAVGQVFRDAGLQRVAIHCAAATEIFTATALLAYWAGSSAGRAAATGWLAVIAIEPLLSRPLLYSISPDAPELATLITVPLLVVPLWENVGRGALWYDGLRIAAIGLLLWFQFVALSLFAVLSYPFIIVTGFVFLFSAWPDRREFVRKIASAVLLAMALIGIGLPQVLLGIITDTAFQLFPEVLRPKGNWHDCTILLDKRPAGVMLAFLGLIGAAAHAVHGNGRMRALAVAVLLLFAVIFLDAIFYMLVGFSGAKPIYYEYALWAVYPVFAVWPLTAAWPYLERRLPRVLTTSPFRWIVIPLGAVLTIQAANAAEYHLNRAVRSALHIRTLDSRPNVFPPKPSEITDYLHRAIGLHPGGPFRGRVVTLTRQDPSAAVVWEEMFDRDMELIRLIGNDHRTIGLWYYGIPTLMEFTHTISPLLQLVTSRYLANPNDPPRRSVLHMRRANVDILRLLGVRYIITDTTRPIAGASGVRSLRLDSGERVLALDEIPNPNLGVSPTEIMRIGSAEEAFAWLDRPQLDFSREVLLDAPLPQGLVRADRIDIDIERGGFRVSASSPGRSLVMVPFQFSNCWRATTAPGTAPPEIRRADLLLTAVVFEKRVEAVISYDRPLFAGAYCWLRDRADVMKLLGR